MCLIIAPGKDGGPALLPRDVFDYVYKSNKDGFGAMWVEDGRVNHFKTLGLQPDEIYGTMEEYVERFPDVIFHMRLKTHGKIIPGLCHPFRILNKNRHGKDMFFMHNGVLSEWGNNLSYGQSDTTRFKDKILVPLLTRDPDALEDPEVWAALNKMTSGSRLVFMDSDGKTYFTSENSWNDRHGTRNSNTYMLPPENYHDYGYGYSMTGDGDNVPTVLTGKETQVTGHFIYYRQIDKAGLVSSHWVNCPKIGYIRTESGLLYKDNGPNKKIYHAANYIPKDQEFKHLGLVIVPSKYDADNDVGSDAMDWVDDEVPFDFPPKSKDKGGGSGGGPAPEGQRLRYARLVNNTHGNKVTSRVHLMADLIGMTDDELFSLIKEDATTANTIMADLIEQILLYNQELWTENPNNKMVLDADEVVTIGQDEYHRFAIQEVSAIRRQEAEQQLAKINEILDAPEGEVHVA